MQKIFIFSFLILQSFVCTAQWSRTNGPQGGFPNTFARISNKIFCGTNHGMYSSTDEGIFWQEFNPFAAKKIHSIITFSDTIIVAFNNSVNQEFSNDSIFTRTSFDGGINWSIPYLISSKKNSSAKLKVSNNIILAECTSALFISNDFGISWTQINMPTGFFRSMSLSGIYMYIQTTDSFNTSHQNYIVRIDSLSFHNFDQTDSYSDKLFIDSTLFGLQLATPANYRVFSSSDLGQSWSPISLIDSSSNFQFISYDDTLYYGGSLFYWHFSTDHAISWDSCYRPIQLDRLLNSFPLLNGDKIGYSTQLNNLAHYSYLPTNDTVYVSDSGMIESEINFIYSNDTLAFCIANIHLYRSIDNGLNWDNRGSIDHNENLLIYGDTIFQNSMFFLKSFDGGLSFTFPQNILYLLGGNLARREHRIFASDYTGQIYYSDDYFETWITLPSLPTISSCGVTNSISQSLCINNNSLYTSSNGVVYKLDSTDIYWTEVLCFPSSKKSSIQTINNKLIFLCDSAMLISSDNGNNWVNCALNGIPTDTLGFKHCPMKLEYSNGDMIGIFGDFGIYTSWNDGNDWTRLDPNQLPFIPKFLSVQNNQLLVGTSTQSVWTSNLLLNINHHSQLSKINLETYPNPTSEFIYLNLINAPTHLNTIYIYNTVGNKIESFECTGKTIKLDLHNLVAGFYFGKIISNDDGYIGTFRFEIIK